MELTLPLEPDAPGGRYPVLFTCGGQVDGVPFSQAFTVFVTVPEADGGDGDLGGDPAPADGADDGGAGFSAGAGGSAAGSEPTPEPTPPAQPKLMIVAQSVTPAPVEAGSPFSLSVTLKNTSGSVSAANLLITVEGDGTDVYGLDGQCSAYFPAVKPGEVFTVTAQMMSAPEASPGPKKILLHAGYDASGGSSYTQDESAAVQIVQVVRFAVDEPEIPASLPAGEIWSLPVNVMNLGRAAIRNVSALVAAPGITTQSTLFLGNLDSGTAKKGTLYAFVGPKSDAEGEARYGRTQGVLTVSCEDEFGAVHQETLPFELQIEAPVIRSAQNEEEEPPAEAAFPWQVSVLIGAGLAAAAAVPLLRRRRQERKREAE